jgi:hypothetical protein
MKSHLDRLWSRWKDLPPEYQRQKRQTLEDYLALFTSTNGAAWNDQWTIFTTKMGPEFAPFYADVIETMKIAEVYEAGFPNPDEKLPRVADAILQGVPSNALLFIQNDVFETALTLRQQDGKRKDVLVLNSSRVMDQSYLGIALSGAHPTLKLSLTNLTKRVIEEALRKKNNGDAEFQGLQIAGEKFHADGIQLITSMSLLMMREISSTMPDRAALFLPSLPDGGSFASWTTLTNNSLFFVLAPGHPLPERSLLSDWEAIFEPAAPLGCPLHSEMAVAIGQSMRATVAILTAQGQTEAPDKLRNLWAERLKGVKVINSKDIRITKEGKMVAEGPANRSQTTPPETSPPSSAPGSPR